MSSPRVPHANTFEEKKEEAAIFSRGYYTKETFDWWTTHPYRHHTLRHLVRYVKEEGLWPDRPVRVLEPACGCGVNLANLAKDFRDFEYFGLDLSEQGCQVAREYGPGSYVVADAEDIPVGTETIDICLSIAAIHHFHRRPERFLREMYRILRKGGVLYIFEPENNLTLSSIQKLRERWLKFRIRKLNRDKEFSGYGHIPSAPTEGPFRRDPAVDLLQHMGMNLVQDGYSEYMTEWARHFERGFERAATFDRGVKPARTNNGRWATGGTKYYAILTK